VGPAVMPGRCAFPGCECHTREEKRVLTPFPLGLGPAYCCNECAVVPFLVREGQGGDE
jgi:hypothetical protein